MHTIGSLACYTDIGHLTVHTGLAFQSYMPLEKKKKKKSLNYHPEAMNLKSWVNISSSTNASGTLWRQKVKIWGRDQRTRKFPISAGEESSLELQPHFLTDPIIIWLNFLFRALYPEEQLRHQRSTGELRSVVICGHFTSICRSFHLALRLRKYLRGMMLSVILNFYWELLYSQFSVIIFSILILCWMQFSK